MSKRLENNKNNMGSELWTDIYKPKNIINLPGNIKYLSIKKWLSEWQTNKDESLKILLNRTSTRKNKTDIKLPHSCMIITGPKGTGKTTTVELVARECGYQIYNLDKELLKDMKRMKEIINSISKVSNISDMMKNKKSKDIILVVDNLENIKVNIEKKNLKILQKENDTKWILPIFFVSDSQHNKLKSGFVKVCEKNTVYPPSDMTMHQIMTNIMKDNSQMFKGKDAADIIIDHAQYDIRRLINTLQELYKIYGKNQMTMENVKDYINISKKKDQDVGLFEATEKLLCGYETMSKCKSLFETDKVLIPLTVHQNFKKALVLKSANEKVSQYDSLQTMMKVADSLSKADLIENYIYAEQNWDVQQIHGFYSCALPSYTMSYSEKNDPTVDNSPNYILQFDFAEDFNKTLIKNINRKMIFNTNEAFPNMSINDFIYVDKILKYLIATNNIKQCKYLLKNYNIKIENIESLLKIVKIKKDKDKDKIKTTISSKHKSQFKKCISV
jgi:replication factor C subunit 1